jgi:hypothetical protein
MKARPILFSTPMVQAILEGRKTQTRRVLKVQPSAEGMQISTLVCTTANKKNEGKQHWIKLKDKFTVEFSDQSYFKCPYGKVGDLLWVRETFTEEACLTAICYKADFPIVWPKELTDGEEIIQEAKDYRFKPSIFMPKWASRITLEITNIRVERLQDISEEDKIAEGGTADKPFGTIWKKINITEGIRWQDNPFVWVLEFKVHKCNFADIVGVEGE